jgi:hypothetical protein
MARGEEWVTIREMAVAAITLCIATASLAAQEPAAQFRLELRKIEASGIAKDGVRVPAGAARVWEYEGSPLAVKVNAATICVDYGRSGVLFDRKSGAVITRATFLDGWPKQRAEGFPTTAPEHRLTHAELVGPGVLQVSHGVDYKIPDHEVVATCEFGGQVWRAMQPGDFLQTIMRKGSPKGWEMTTRPAWPYDAWTGILAELNTDSYIEVWPRGVKPPDPSDVAGKSTVDSQPAPPRASGDPAEAAKQVVRYTMAEGLAGNIVTQFAAADGKLWAASVDIYDPRANAWGAGGLSWFDPKVKRWQQLYEIDGRPVRWVTLLQTVGNDLWVGFLEGSEVEGDTIFFGQGGVNTGTYRPVAAKLVLARLSGGKWASFTRHPIPEPTSAEQAQRSDREPPTTAPAKQIPPTEAPMHVALVGEKVFLFSASIGRRAAHGWAAGWGSRSEGHVSLLDTSNGQWRVFDTRKDLGALHLSKMVADDGEIFLFTDKGLHRWLGKEHSWAFLDTQSPIVNPTLSSWALVGNEFWIGFNMQSVGVVGVQGISRFNEDTATWSYFSPTDIGTTLPVRTIIPIGKDEAWVYFAARHWAGLFSEEPIYYGEEKFPNDMGVLKWESGQPIRGTWAVAHFAGGKWELGAKLQGVPDSIDRQSEGPDGVQKWKEPLWIGQVIRLGDKAYMNCNVGVYEGPGQWKQIVEEQVWKIHPAVDGKSLEIIHPPENRTLETMGKVRLGLYEPATGRIQWSETDIDKLSAVKRGMPEGDLLRSRDPYDGIVDTSWKSQWTRLPTKKEGDWAIGSLVGDAHVVIQTPWAVWIAGDGGELIRLDRTLLKDWLAN